MSEQERITAFMQAYHQLCALYGVQLGIQARVYRGNAVIELVPEPLPVFIPRAEPPKDDDGNLG